MAPEQGLDAHKADIRSDIYSLGCTLFYLLTGRLPFEGATPLEMMSGHLHREVPALAPLRPDAPPGLEAVLHRMLAKKPEDRYQTPAEVTAVLSPFTQRKSRLAAAVTLTPPTKPVNAPETLVETQTAAGAQRRRTTSPRDPADDPVDLLSRCGRPATVEGRSGTAHGAAGGRLRGGRRHSGGLRLEQPEPTDASTPGGLR